MADTPTNGRNMASLEIPIGDALMMMEAMRLAANTAMLSSLPDAEKRLREYKERFSSMVPPAARHFDGEVLCEINIHLSQAQTFEVEVELQKGWPYRQEGRVIVTIGGRRWPTKTRDIRDGDERFAAIVALLEELAPMDCILKSRASVNPQSS